MPVRLGEEVQAMLRRGDSELTAAAGVVLPEAPTPQCGNCGLEFLNVKQAGRVFYFKVNVILQAL